MRSVEYRKIVACVPTETPFHCPITGKAVMVFKDGEWQLSTEGTCVLWVNVSEVGEEYINPLFQKKYEKLQEEFEEVREDYWDMVEFVRSHKDCQNYFSIVLDSSEGPLTSWVEFLIDLELLNDQYSSD
jgi:hypothetical protein